MHIKASETDGLDKLFRQQLSLKVVNRGYPPPPYSQSYDVRRIIRQDWQNRIKKN